MRPLMCCNVEMNFCMVHPCVGGGAAAFGRIKSSEESAGTFLAGVQSAQVVVVVVGGSQLIYWLSCVMVDSKRGC